MTESIDPNEQYREADATPKSNQLKDALQNPELRAKAMELGRIITASALQSAAEGSGLVRVTDEGVKLRKLRIAKAALRPTHTLRKAAQSGIKGGIAGARQQTVNSARALVQQQFSDNGSGHNQSDQQTVLELPPIKSEHSDDPFGLQDSSETPDSAQFEYTTPSNDLAPNDSPRKGFRRVFGRGGDRQTITQESSSVQNNPFGTEHPSESNNDPFGIGSSHSDDPFGLNQK